MDNYKNDLAQYYFNKDYEELTENEKEIIDNQLQIGIEEAHPAHPDNR